MTYPASGHQATITACRWFALSTLILFTAGCAEPFIVMSGGVLSGPVEDAPVDWTELNQVEIAQLETNPSEPYSVNIWLAGIGSNIYVATGDDDTNWTVHIADNPDVRLRIDGTIYELEAEKVSDSAEKQTVIAAYVEKYPLDEEDNWVQDGQVFRLDRR